MFYKKNLDVMRDLYEHLNESLPLWIAFLFTFLCFLIRDINYEFAKGLYFSLLFISEIGLLLQMYKHPSRFM